MNVAERMAARLASTPADTHGTPCRHCGTTALACQHHFVTTNNERHCCGDCRAEGGGRAHAAPAETTR